MRSSHLYFCFVYAFQNWRSWSIKMSYQTLNMVPSGKLTHSFECRIPIGNMPMVAFPRSDLSCPKTCPQLHFVDPDQAPLTGGWASSKHDPLIPGRTHLHCRVHRGWQMLDSAIVDDMVSPFDRRSKPCTVQACLYNHMASVRNMTACSCLFG